jgi:hypothetical protein
MAVPVIETTYPADGDIGIPVGCVLYVDFDRGVDVSTCRNSVILYGADRDLASGPNSAIWLDKDAGLNPQYLRSPGFKGLVETDIELVYVDAETGEELDIQVEDEAYELAYGTAGAVHRLRITPKQHLAPDTEYNFYIMGDPDSADNGISSRTVFDVLADPANGSDTGSTYAYGGYTRSEADRVIVEVTTSGAIGTAKYRWYYENEGVASARNGCVTSRRYRRLEDGVQIRFGGSGFVQGDLYRFRVEPIERLETNTRVVFTTNDGTYSEAPDSPSTPATSSAPSTVIPTAPSEELSSSSTMTILSSEPPNGAYQMNRNLREFTVTFSDSLDPATITQDTVRVYKYPVSGIFTGSPQAVELAKVLEVSGDTLTIKI